MTLKKNSSISAKDTQLLTLFKAHFSGHLNSARIRLICLFTNALCKVKSVNYVKISAGFDTSVDASSSYRRIQRFMALTDLSMIWVTKLIFSLLAVFFYVNNRKNLKKTHRMHLIITILIILTPRFN